MKNKSPTHRRTRSQPTRLPCHHFARTGRCKFEDACKFSHETEVITAFRTHTAAQANGESNSTEANANVDYMYLLRSARPLRPFQCRQVFLDAIKKLDSGDAAQSQQLIDNLAKDNGLQHIRRFLEGQLTYASSHDGMAADNSLSFLRHCVPFLQMLSHTELRHSMVMEKQVGTIFNVIYGPGGERAIDFFEKVLQCLESMSRDAGQNSDQFALVYGFVVGVMLFVVKLNSGALIQKDFKQFAHRLVELAAVAEMFDDNNHLEIRRDILALGKRLDIGDALAAVAPKTNSKTGSKIRGKAQQATDAFYQNRVEDLDFPGNLSTAGPRHNNDHQQFQNIQILPTADEIASSDRPEFLPLADPTAPHFLEDVPRLLDSQFRLLREDNIGPIRDALRNLLELNEENRRVGKKLGEKVTLGGTKVFVHQNVIIEGITFHPFKGLQICVGFSQPKGLANKSKADRQAWWETSFSFDRGALVCYVDQNQRCTLLVVSERIVVAKPKKTVADKNNPDDDAEAVDLMAELDLASDRNQATIRLAFTDSASAEDIAWLRQELNLSLTAGAGFQPNSYLVEFPKVLLPSFKPVLRCLQQHMTLGDQMPFDEWFVPGGQAKVTYASLDGKVATVPPALYARKPNCVFDLQSICIDADEGRPLTLIPGKANQFDVNLLKARSTLDLGQCAALVAGLTKEVALIQGPPGTGKSYVGVQLIRVLVNNKRLNRSLGLGPIVCVCFTNHALDQLLEDLLDAGIGNMIRLGTRSKSEKVSALSMGDGHPTKHEQWESRKTRAQLYDQRDEASTACANLSAGGGKLTSWRQMMKFLEANYPHIHYQLDASEEEDDEGFKLVTGRSRRSPIETWLYDKYAPRRLSRGGYNIDVLTTEDITIWQMSPEQRQLLVSYWMDEMVEKAEDDLRRVVTEHGTTLEHLDKVQHEVNRRQLDACDVIGVTTSGFARNIDLLRAVNAKVLLSEEAGEILEAHTLTNLLPNLEHVILIGDHLQLRPKATNYELSVESRQGQRYSLDVSLFERLTQASFGEGALRFPTVALDVQRRMHPSIANLVRSTLYRSLKDHEGVLEYRPIAGMRRRLFWFDHRHPETEGNDPSQLIQTSYTNKFEQEMVMALVRHLLRQGNIGGKGLAVITPYVGQLLRFKRLMAASYEIVIGDRDQELLEEQLLNEGLEAEQDAQTAEQQRNPGKTLNSPTILKKQKLSNSVRLATVDNFQGEEADIVIVSLVRSNRNNNCGFLKTKNRINVLLSRARRGMYIIGNTNTASSAPMWEDVIQLLEQNDNIGQKLELECSRHKEKEIFVKSPEDFSLFSPEGGCDERCSLRLECGHSCRAKCHSAALHSLVPCDEPCNKLLVGCDHPCESTCSAPCGKCKVIIKNVVLPCQHVVEKMPCHQAQHIELYKCLVQVTKTVPGCGHVVKTTCSNDVASSTYRCNKPCGLTISTCGHDCSKSCFVCRSKQGDKTVIDHGSCQKICDRPFNNCAHSCRQICHAAKGSECGLCQQKCVIGCAHSRCPKKCSEPCAPCAEVCKFGCIHQGSCRLPCAVPCEILPCSERCPLTLSCGHQCPSLCGEKCPNAQRCQTCAPQHVLDVQVDFVMMETFGEIDPNDSPVVFLACGHFFTVESLDGIMGLRDIYQYDEGGIKITGIKETAWENPIDKLGNCPTCRAPISNVRRYSYVQRRAQMQIATRKFIAHSHSTFIGLELELNAAERLLEETRKQQLGKNRRSRYNELYVLCSRIERYTQSVTEMEQPFHRVYDLAVAAKHRGQVETADLPLGGASNIVQFRFRLQGMCLLLRARTALQCDRDMVLDAEKKEVSLHGGDDEEKTKQRRSAERLICNSAVKALKICEDVIEESSKRSQPALEVEASIYFAKLATLRLKHDQTFSDPSQAEPFRSTILQCLDNCDAIIKTHASVAYLTKEVENARTAVRQKEFYSTVTDEERRAVYQAMAQEFQGTGHWYYCPQGHPYTIGNCGLPNQNATCPQCGVGIGGSGYQLAAGSRRADDFEARARGG